MSEIEEAIRNIQENFKNGTIPEKFYLLVHIENFKKYLREAGWEEGEISEQINLIKNNGDYIIE